MSSGIKQFYRRTLAALGRRNEIALCMNSSFFGFYAHAGFLEGMLEAGIRPDHIAGASAGALVAGFYAAGKEVAEMTPVMLDPAVRKAFTEWRAPLRAASIFTGCRGASGALSGDKVLKLLKTHLGEKQIEDCDPRLSLSVLNLTRGESQVKRNGPLAEFILASCAVPGMFQTRMIGGEEYWDGGVADPAPFEDWLDNPRIKTIIVHLALSAGEGAKSEGNVNPGDGAHRSGKNAGGARRYNLYSGLERSFEISAEEILRLKFKLAEKAGKQLLVIKTRHTSSGAQVNRRGGL